MRISQHNIWNIKKNILSDLYGVHLDKIDKEKEVFLRKNLALEYANRVAVIKEGEKILEIGVEGEQIVDFQTGNLSQEEILEMYNES